MSRRTRERISVDRTAARPPEGFSVKSRAGWNYDTSEIPLLRTGPITTRDERQLIRGEITMEQYLDRREPSAELKVLRKQEEKYRSRHVLPFFLATATVVYFATAVVFLVVASTSASVTALLISVAFLIATTFTQTLTRDGK